MRLFDQTHCLPAEESQILEAQETAKEVNVHFGHSQSFFGIVVGTGDVQGRDHAEVCP